jgi:hypothetical protein
VLETVEGIYRNGLIELKELPKGVTHAHVLVTFLPSEHPEPQGEMMRYGKYGGVPVLNEEDFRMAEWHGEDEDEAAT